MPRTVRAPASLAPQAGRSGIEPMLPALARSVVFFCTLAMPFVAALLVG
ncbi:hypothetical protein JQ604_17155 [Bradyrhizobium jicamae]|nr:hypothetical protein [Bradyrhizobium jicamae]MBR0753915.1 hypothetical protein [Bradyrhizobium jicamae]